MKLVIVCIFSWLAGLLAYLGALAAFYRQSISSGDLIFAVVWSGVAFAFACMFIYLPVLMGMQRLLGGVRPASFPLVSALLGVAPTAFLFYCWGGNLGSLVSPEASLFYVLFSAAGFLLGLGYVRIQRQKGG